MDVGGSVDETPLSEEAPWRGPRGGGGSSFTGDPERYVKKVSGYGHLSPWGPLSIRGEPDFVGGGPRISGALMNKGGL
jgi:hypothetical protein